MKHFLKYIYSVLAIILVVSCATSRKAADQQKDNVLSDWQSGDAVVSRAAIKIKNGREREISLSGNLKMLRNDVIILNATYIFGIQIGFIELTPEKANKLHDDRSYCMALCAWFLSEKRLENIRARKKPNATEIIDMLPVNRGKPREKLFG